MEPSEIAAPEWPVLRAWLDGKNPTGLAADLMEVEVASIIREVERLREQRDRINQTARHGYDMLERALEGMNEAVRLTFASGSSAVGMEYIGNWLNEGDAVDDETAELLGDAPFPPEVKPRITSTNRPPLSSVV